METRIPPPTTTIGGMVMKYDIYPGKVIAYGYIKNGKPTAVQKHGLSKLEKVKVKYGG